MMEQDKILEVLKKLAVEAGNIILEVYETDFAVDYKEDDSPLTMADRMNILSGDCRNIFRNMPFCQRR